MMFLLVPIVLTDFISVTFTDRQGFTKATSIRD
jgi:hypothetical protein